MSDQNEVMGRWIEENPRPKSFMFICSACGQTAYDTPRVNKKYDQKKICRLAYCPHCGTKMELEQE